MKAVAIRHVLFEDLGLIEPVLRDRGYEVSYLEAGIDPIEPDLELVDLLVVLGGPIGVGDVDSYPFLGEEISMIARRLEASGPTLGICLGAQLMASALGAEVNPTGRTEIGYGELDLVSGTEPSVLEPLRGVPALHWHGDEFQIPHGAERLASTEGFPNQAFRKGEGALALQFHLETDPRYLERWLVGHAGELSDAGIEPQSMRDDAARHGDRMAAACRQVIEGWLEGI